MDLRRLFCTIICLAVLVVPVSLPAWAEVSEPTESADAAEVQSEPVDENDGAPTFVTGLTPLEYEPEYPENHEVSGKGMIRGSYPSSYTTYSAKIQESTHIFIADFVPLDSRITAENSRVIINSKRYDVTLIDNPMEMGSGSQLEIYLKYTGGQ